MIEELENIKFKDSKSGGTNKYKHLYHHT
jgi:hypothetical protein